MKSSLVQLRWAGRPLQIEVAWVGSAHASAVPTMVFLHEGLGCVAAWRDFPARLCEAIGCRGLVYSRPGYGRSTPRAKQEHWHPDFMHQQAQELLPMLLAALGVHEAVRLFGHSDGGSIALLHAALPASRVVDAIVLAPHIMVEELSIASIAAMRRAFLETDLRKRLAKYHDDPDSAFWGWNDIWLQPVFRHWSIEDELAAIRCPLLAIQGLDDEFGTVEQVRGIARRVPQTQLLELANCGHSPHRDQPEAVINAVRSFVQARPSSAP